MSSQSLKSILDEIGANYTVYRKEGKYTFPVRYNLGEIPIDVLVFAVESKEEILLLAVLENLKKISVENRYNFFKTLLEMNYSKLKGVGYGIMVASTEDELLVAMGSIPKSFLTRELFDIVMDEIGFATINFYANFVYKEQMEQFLDREKIRQRVNDFLIKLNMKPMSREAFMYLLTASIRFYDAEYHYLISLWIERRWVNFLAQVFELNQFIYLSGMSREDALLNLLLDNHTLLGASYCIVSLKEKDILCVNTEIDVRTLYFENFKTELNSVAKGIWYLLAKYVKRIHAEFPGNEVMNDWLNNVSSTLETLGLEHEIIEGNRVLVKGNVTIGRKSYEVPLEIYKEKEFLKIITKVADLRELGVDKERLYFTLLQATYFLGDGKFSIIGDGIYSETEINLSDLKPDLLSSNINGVINGISMFYKYLLPSLEQGTPVPWTKIVEEYR